MLCEGCFMRKWDIELLEINILALFDEGVYTFIVTITGITSSILIQYFWSSRANSKTSLGLVAFFLLLVDILHRNLFPCELTIILFL